MCRILAVGGPEYGRLGFAGFDAVKVVVPGNNLPVIAEGGSRFIAKWGFPHYSGGLVFNARAESVYYSIVQGSGYWKDVEIGYVPVTGFKEGGRWFALYDDKTPEPVYSLAVFDTFRKRVALVTTVASSPVRDYHDRQPYIVSQPVFPSRFEEFFTLPLLPVSSTVAGW